MSLAGSAPHSSPLGGHPGEPLDFQGSLESGLHPRCATPAPVWLLAAAPGAQSVGTLIILVWVILCTLHAAKALGGWDPHVKQKVKFV